MESSDGAARDQFAILLQQALQKAEPTLAVEYDSSQFCLNLAGERNVFLTNFYQEYHQAPAENRGQLLRRWTRLLLSVGNEHDVPTDYETAKDHLRPKIWMRWSMEGIRLQSLIEDRPEFDTAMYPIGEHLCLTLVYDMPQAMQSLPPQMLDTWGVTFYEALETAKENLAEAPMKFATVGDNQVLLAVTGDNYDATRLLLIDRLDELPIKGDLIAMVPNRDSLFIGDADDEQSLMIMLQLEAQALQQPRPMLPTPLRWEDGEWVDWMPAESHPAFPQLKQLEVEFLANIYEHQKGMLEALFAKRDEKVFVVSFGALKSKSDQVMTFSLWAESLDSLLPKTDLIAFRKGSGEHLLVPWTAAAPIVGDLLRPTDDYPRRFRAMEFPSEEQLAQLAAKRLM